MTPEVIAKIPEMRQRGRSLRAGGKTIGFVPTMGGLHEGHLSLMRRSRAENDVSIISIFVNPAQFGPDEDFGEYPRTWDVDLEKAAGVGVDLVFTTTPAEMYPEGFSTFVAEEAITIPLCGRSRPHFFRGVLTVVLKLFQIVGPHRSYFGEKDFQQQLAVRKMVDDFHLDVDVVSCPIVREEDGLALSSRNRYLSPAERSEAIVIPRALALAESLIVDGLKDAVELKGRLEGVIEQSPSARIDYLDVLSPETLTPLADLEGEILVALAVFVGRTRLIDNRVIRVP